MLDGSLSVGNFPVKFCSQYRHLIFAYNQPVFVSVPLVIGNSGRLSSLLVDRFNDQLIDQRNHVFQPPPFVNEVTEAQGSSAFTDTSVQSNFMKLPCLCQTWSSVGNFIWLIRIKFFSISVSCKLCDPSYLGKLKGEEFLNPCCINLLGLP